MAESLWCAVSAHLELIGTIVGLVYLWLEYRASIYLWIAGIVMPAIYIFVYYDAGLYADCGINVYYLLVAVYGWAVWKKKQLFKSASAGVAADKEAAGAGAGEGIVSMLALPVERRRRLVTVLFAVFVLLFLFLAWLLLGFTDSTVPWLDSFTTALSIVAMWLLAHKYLEQWWVWIVVDMVSAGLYVYKELYFTSVLYLLYAVIAVFGYRKWVEIMQRNE